MKPWWLLATRSWQTRPARSLLAVLAVALGVGVVVWVTCCYESVRRGVTRTVLEWIGRSHVIIEHTEGVWAVFDESIVHLVRDVRGVQDVTVRTREYVEVTAPVDDGPPTDPGAYQLIEVTGIVPETEPRFRTHEVAEGRFIQPGDEDAIVVERLLAKQLDLGLGDFIYMRPRNSEAGPRRFRIAGIIDRRRASLNQALMTWTRVEAVQSLVELPGKIKGVDILLTDASPENIRRIAETIRERIEADHAARREQGEALERLEVNTTEAQHQKLGAAQGLLRFIMMLLACVVLLTAFFMILGTMSMDVRERTTELGLLRCVGLTRGSLSGLLMLQTLPLGVVGTILGVPLGLALQWLTMRLVPEYLGDMVLSRWGLALAVGGGFLTTLIGAALPALSAFGVSPVEAARPHGAVRLNRFVWVAAVAGVLLVAGHEWVQRGMSAQDGGERFDALAITALLMLYSGCALVAPLVVAIVGRVSVWCAAVVMRLRPQLLGDEIYKSPFRSAAVCCSLMVGLSLIVGLFVWGNSVKRGWQFPSEIPDALLYSYDPLPLDEVRALRDIDGIAEFTVTDDFGFSLSKPRKKSWLESLTGLDQFSRFLAIELEQGFKVVKLTFLEGDEQDALAKLKAGGHLLVTREFARARDKHLGDALRIWVGNDSARFTIAGVVASPGLDIAISFFNATDYFQTYAVGAIMGTLEDAERHFGRRVGKLMLFNFDEAALADGGEQPISALRAGGPRRETESGRMTFAPILRGPIPGDGPQERIVNRILERFDYPIAAFVTARELKNQIDGSIDRVTLILSVIPLVGLVVAALGLANLMAANITSRAKRTAILRAIGVTKSQMSRIVISEALVLGVLGSAMGLGLGMLLGRTSNGMTHLLSGFEPSFAIPWGMVAAGAGLATLLCLVAGLVPALHASRSNIISVLASD